MSNELIYLLLIFGLLVIPRALQRFKLPAPITCLILGVGAMLAFGERTHDPVIVLLSTLGISSLFLFAGLEVDLQALRKGLGRLVVLPRPGLAGGGALYTTLNTLLPSRVLHSPFDVDPMDSRPVSHPEDRMRAEGAAAKTRAPTITD